MIADLKPYPEYKEAGLPWLDAIPAHWGMVPNRALMQDQRQVVGENATDYKLLSLTLRGIVPRNMDNPKGKFPAKFNTYKVVRPEDIVFCLFDIDETPRGVGHSKLNGMITGAYDVFSPRQSINPRFLYYYYLSLDEGKMLKPLYTGLRKTIKRGIFASLKAPLPPLSEQAAIVRFLDWANGRLERAIRAKRKVIALLTEQKQAIISSLVTGKCEVRSVKGEDGREISQFTPRPSHLMKPSGIPWLGEIPQHWDVITIGAVTTLIQTGPFGSQLHSHEYVTGGISVINPSHMQNGAISPSPDIAVSKKKAKELERHKMCPGDVVAARRGELGRCALVATAESGWICGTGSLLLRCKSNIMLPAYFAKIFSSRGITDMLNLSSIGATMANLNAGMVARQRIPVPPVDQQEQIVRFIDGENRQTEVAINKIEREIELLREYRTRLVADVVTGKLDVREAAARLPEDTAPDIASEPTDGLDETEPADEEAAV